MTLASPEVINLVVDLQAVSYVSISFLTILFYDWIICLNWEITRIWHSKWSLVKVLYLYVRYAPFVSMIIAVEERLSSTCNLLTFNTIFAGVAIGMADLILMLRTYSIYNKSRRILTILALIWIAISAVSVWVIIQFTSSFQVLPVTASQSCFLSYEKSPIGLVTYLGLLGGEIVVTLLTVWRTFDSYLKSGFQWGQVLSLVYCEGLFFYFLIIRKLSPQGFSVSSY
ncbi:hypothetical protein GYMLUDRAFT_49488 [Collybiopsis luxurians FD-317 M1]|uniref:DUF6533 domain-containing protein n=1 Tax=Collybiopsis luxurians FD-317 M1 TaxID=944289 RepID=A0A0D0CDU6_9AGAR|nr:hypothetical protein GYMLUDRAFT_49488 [Collybiopsis luxurians FD-317 M1]